MVLKVWEISALVSEALDPTKATTTARNSHCSQDSSKTTIKSVLIPKPQKPTETLRAQGKVGMFWTVYNSHFRKSCCCSLKTWPLVLSPGPGEKAPGWLNQASGETEYSEEPSIKLQ